ncbi:MAG: hypothetical protein Q8O74_06265, partial [bacterium]|nr:hypothetical protein [bacterium]
YKLKLNGLSTPQGTIPLRALKEICDILLETAERGLRLAVESESVKPGKLPSWLAASLNMTVTGLEKGSTCLAIDVPVLGETAGKRIAQQNLWNTAPKPDDTAFSLLSRAVSATTTGKEDSYYYDKGVLDSLLKIKPFIHDYADKMELSCLEKKKDHFILGEKELDKILNLKTKTPEPQAMVISGKFDLIEHAKKRFRLQLSNGETLIGTIDPEHLSVEQMRKHWGGSATVKGMVHYHPSGKPRLIVADVIKEMTTGEEILSYMPRIQTEIEYISQARTMAGHKKDWLKEIWNKWPGDESVDELLAALKHT